MDAAKLSRIPLGTGARAVQHGDLERPPDLLGVGDRPTAQNLTAPPARLHHGTDLSPLPEGLRFITRLPSIRVKRAGPRWMGSEQTDESCCSPASHPELLTVTGLRQTTKLATELHVTTGMDLKLNEIHAAIVHTKQDLSVKADSVAVELGLLSADQRKLADRGTHME
ncbi:hypothetical protein NDU88_004998 [Pleurodeles waltl]|uniref:Uncharacterized protein n=1 Tax=Pleurodeles waltl TaxID=8319 RepID=A0AAV7LLM3_PLEWA|nr:hypothetical protein NDU88_004998 [Pleurodeles waltl]